MRSSVIDQILYMVHLEMVGLMIVVALSEYLLLPILQMMNMDIDSRILD